MQPCRTRHAACGNRATESNPTEPHHHLDASITCNCGTHSEDILELAIMHRSSLVEWGVICCCPAPSAAALDKLNTVSSPLQSPVRLLQAADETKSFSLAQTHGVREP